jgi:hypothetical protein
MVLVLRKCNAWPTGPQTCAITKRDAWLIYVKTKQMTFIKLSTQSCYWMSLQHHILNPYLKQFQHGCHAKCWCGSNISPTQCEILKIFITRSLTNVQLLLMWLFDWKWTKGGHIAQSA